MAIIEMAFKHYLNELSFMSREMFEESTKHKGRGAFVSFFDSVARLMSSKDGPGLYFIPQNKLIEIYGACKLTEFVSSYNPKEQFVVHVSVCVFDDGFTECAIIHKDTYKSVKPIYDKNTGKEIKGSLKTLKNLNIQESNFQCVTCGIKSTTMKQCGKCKSFTYCDKTCQVKDWPNHKKVCVSIKDSIDQAISTMK